VGVVIWYLSIPPHNNSRAVVKNLRIFVCRHIFRLTITHLKLKIVTSHHQVLSQFWNTQAFFQIKGSKNYDAHPLNKVIFYSNVSKTIFLQQFGRFLSSGKRFLAAWRKKSPNTKKLRLYYKL
jgi:hypothetical protein